ncbi:downy mildew resistance [Hyphodiscus hymeniophilus]|uniref:Downy mildew resistance n=1 Tax=Hyphodiscus hymeniophilus TaxID=353542 RepID=A0A9P6SJR6_9HELO|nr:downy mildew resistance [Hyphodiscus hymeniophilus]
MGYADWTEDGEKTAFGSVEISQDTIVGDFDTIPVLDVSGMFSSNIAERKKFAGALRDACMRVGFFYIENHGIESGFVDEAFEWGRKFFDLPFEEKMEVYIDNTPHFRGYTPLHGSGKPDAEGKGNANEAFDFGHDPKLNDDPNDKWVDTFMRGYNPWPRQLPGFEKHLSSYYRRLRSFCRIMARSIALSLDLPEDYFEKYLTHPGCSSLIAHYPPQPPGSILAKGLDAHTDAECRLFPFPPFLNDADAAQSLPFWLLVQSEPLKY